ncbi:MAG: sugar phosphate isomerase/epimerase [Planctomycetes bacterium]|nr:sugar phosphate isomerase/epimerase [Planctomycetota bacterium]
MRRRDFLTAAAAAASAAASLGSVTAALPGPDRLAARPGDRFSISLAQWSLHRAHHEGRMTALDFPAKARSFGIAAVEYVNSFFKDKVRDEEYLKELKSRCEDAGVRSVLIMCDGEGALGDADAAGRTRAVENHYPWVEAAAFLGCHSIRVNAGGGGSREELAEQAADGLRRLCEFADPHGVSVIVENHGGWSSHGGWLAGVIRSVGHERCGTLPDFGNFRISGEESYDPYRGVEELMPFAKGVSAKSHDFDPETGEETRLDYRRMLRIVAEAGYSGFIGVEYEGGRLSEEDGIRATQALLKRYQNVS